METYAEEEEFWSQHRKMLLSRFTVQNGTHINPLVLVFFELGLVCTKKNVWKIGEVSRTRRKTKDEIPFSSVVADTMKLLANSSYGYQTMDRS